MNMDVHQPADDAEPVTRGGPAVAPRRPVGAEGTKPAPAPASEPDVWFVGPPDDPDRYHLVGSGISGGEGTTWRARYHGNLNAPLPLAIKLLRPSPTGDTEPHSAADRRRWSDQTALLRHLELDHVVRLHDVFFGAAPHRRGEADPVAAQLTYLEMEWVEGPTLHELLRGRAVTVDSVRERLTYVAEAAEALAGLVSWTRTGGNPSLHRDVKPANCIVHDRRGLVLIDVSTLRLAGVGFDLAGLHTPGYTAPEVMRAPHLPRNAAADVYSLGALAVFCLTGHDPPVPDKPQDLEKIADELTVLARQAAIDDVHQFVAHIIATLQLEPDRRPLDLAAWGKRLLTFVAASAPLEEQGHGRGVGAVAETRSVLPRLARRRGIVSLGLTLIAVLATVAALLLVNRSPGAGSGRGPRSTGSSPSVIDTASPASSRSPRVSFNPADVTGTITSPANRSDVPQCAYLQGTAHLPPNATLILSMKNLDNGDPNDYPQAVFGFRDPARLSTWRGAQYFGQTDGPIDQHYRVELVAVDLDQAIAWAVSDDQNLSNTLVATGVPLASIEVRRIDGLGPNNCEGP